MAIALSGCAAAAKAPVSSRAPERATALQGRSFTQGAVAADHPVASLAGLEMLQRGGNAVDAAVATSFALSVVRPYSCGIGGGGFMLISLPRNDQTERAEAIVLNYRESAPRNVAPDHFANLPEDAARFGGHAVGVPGTVLGLLVALHHYGSLDRQTVLEPAIRAAEQGVPADANFIAAARHLEALREEHPHLRELSRLIWDRLCHFGSIREGDLIRQPEKARALRLIAEHGAAEFYIGEIADAIVETLHAHGGVITHEDLEEYTFGRSEPLRGRFLDYELLTMPPPSSGGIAIQQMLGIIQRTLDDFDNPAHNSAEYVHLVTEAMKHAFADRAEHLADPDFVDVPVRELTSETYIDELAGRVDRNRTLEDRFAYGSVTPAQTLEHTGGGTSHFSVIDKNGMAVACTETINLIYGSLVYVEEFGIVLNNQMDDFTTIPGQPNAFGLQQSDRNLPQPGKRPLSSMSPTIVLRDDKPALIVGASGGPRIITGTLQTMLNHLLFDMPPNAAVRQPRFHHQWMPNVLQFEESWRGDAVLRAMEERSHDVSIRDEVGAVQLITIDAEGGIRAASDPRKGGEPAGY